MNTKKLAFPMIALVAALIALGFFLNRAMSAGALKPQNPALPLPYYSEDVTFENIDDEITLAGTLTLPKKEGVYPAVVLISGSGPQNRNEELAGHRPFLVLADHLTRKGIAVLRYDDRGTARSEGNFRTAIFSDFASDVRSAVDYLLSRKEIDHNNVGLIGHSEGGVIGPMVAGASDDIAFLVMLAGPGMKSIELLPLQHSLIAKAAGATDEEAQKIRQLSGELFAMTLKYGNQDTLRTKFVEFVDNNWDRIKAVAPVGAKKDEYISKHFSVLIMPWFRDVLNYDPAPILAKIRCPVLALNGEKDVQVPPRENLAGISNALTQGGNTNVTVKELAGLNHLFQECETGGLHEYAKIEQTFSPVALEEISRWILDKVD